LSETTLTTQSRQTGFAIFSNRITMKPAALHNSFFLSALLKIKRYFQAVFRFTEADASCILLAYGLPGFEVDRLQNSWPDEEEDPGAHLVRVGWRKLKGEPPVPIPLGIHPDFISGNWRAPQGRHSGLSLTEGH
jgi:hypothetical protein